MDNNKAFSSFDVQQSALTMSGFVAVAWRPDNPVWASPQVLTAREGTRWQHPPPLLAQPGKVHLQIRALHLSGTHLEGATSLYTAAEP